MIIAAATAEMLAMNMVSLISPILRTNEFNFNDFDNYDRKVYVKIQYNGSKGNYLFRITFVRATCYYAMGGKVSLNGLSLDPPIILEKIFYDTRPIIIIRLTRH
jgi:hypothetical protein